MYLEIYNLINISTNHIILLGGWGNIRWRYLKHLLLKQWNGRRLKFVIMKK